MKRVKVKNKAGVICWQAEMEDQLVAGYIESQTAVKAWGNPDRIIEATEPHDVADVIEEIPSTNTSPAKVKLKAEFTVEIEDMAAEVAAREAKKAAKQAIRGKIKTDLAAVNNVAQLKTWAGDLLKALDLDD